MATSISDLRAESQRLSRSLRSPSLTVEQTAARKLRLERVNLLLTQAIAEEQEEQERRLQARRDSWLEAGESRRLRRSF